MRSGNGSKEADEENTQSEPENKKKGVVRWILYAVLVLAAGAAAAIFTIWRKKKKSRDTDNIEDAELPESGEESFEKDELPPEQEEEIPEGEE